MKREELKHTMKYVFTCQPTSEQLAKEEISLREDMTFDHWVDQSVGIIDIEDNGHLKKEPIFVRHLFPITETFSRQTRIEELATFCFAHIDFETPFSLHIRGIKEEKDFIQELNQELKTSLKEAGYSYDPKATHQILSFYITDTTVYCGYSSAKENLTEWNGGEVHLSPKGTISRAELKLEEIFLEKNERPQNGRALDLGAAPGGWAHFLLKQGFRVTAVDPAKMDKAVQTDKMRHYKMVTQQFIRDVPQKTYDLIVNDMKMDMWESIDIMLDFSEYLTEEGEGILTLKLPKKVSIRTIQKALDKLGTKFNVRKAKQLFHNRSEITVLLGNKDNNQNF